MYASMHEKEYQMDDAGLREWFQNGDIFIVNRGYRDVLLLLENLDIRHKMPALLQPSQRQLDTQVANDSRTITKTRWIVETRNGHIKSVFQFFVRAVSMNHVIKIGDIYQIAGVILNKYREPIVMEGATSEVAKRMLEKSRTPNVIKTRVEIDNLHTRNTRRDQLNANHVPYFPRLDFNYLMDLTMGIYQLKLAPVYIQVKLQREQAEQFQIYELLDERGLIRNV